MSVHECESTITALLLYMYCRFLWALCETDADSALNFEALMCVLEHTHGTIGAKERLAYVANN